MSETMSIPGADDGRVRPDEEEQQQQPREQQQQRKSGGNSASQEGSRKGQGSLSSLIDDDDAMSEGNSVSQTEILRIMAETQRSMAQRMVGPGGGRSKVLSTIKLEEFTGGSGTSAYQYRTWKKETLITQDLNGISDSELAIVIYKQVKGKAKQLLSILELSDLRGENGLEMVWSILDHAHEKLGY